MESVMTQERWDALSDSDKMLLKQLGVVYTPDKQKKPRTVNPITLMRRASTRNSAPEDYYTVIKKTCGCCRKTVLHEGKMTKRKPSDSFLSLLYMEIPAGETFTEMKVVSITCEHCDVELDKLTKEELISMVKTLREVAARRCTI